MLSSGSLRIMDSGEGEEGGLLPSHQNDVCFSLFVPGVGFDGAIIVPIDGCTG